MESKTPRVDANILWRFDDQTIPQGYVDADFARSLELECAAVRAKAFEEEVALGNLWAERDRLLRDRDELVEALDNVQACSASVLNFTTSIKNSLAIDLKSAIEKSRAVLAKVRHD